MSGLPRAGRAARPRGRGSLVGRGRPALQPRRLGLALTAFVASAVGLALTAPLAVADDLTDHRDEVQARLASSRQDLDESTLQLNRAAVAVESAQSRLATAQRQLAGTRRELKAARAEDAAMAATLRRAQVRLAAAKAAVIAGQRRLEAQHATAGEMVRDQYQQQTNLMPIAILVQSNSTADLQTRLQWSTTMFDSTQAEIDRLTDLQTALNAERSRQTTLEQQVEKSRAAAASTLAAKRRLERQAVAQTAGVVTLVRQRSAARARAAAAVASDRREVGALNRERASVEHRIVVRIAQAKAEAARRAASARAAKLAASRAAAKQRASRLAVAVAARRAAARAQARLARQQAAHPSRASQRSTSKRHRAPAHANSAHSRTVHRSRQHRSATPYRSHARSSSSHHGFLFPVGGRITSPYGRRFHPILHIWKLHDGTDFGAGCGTPIHAAYSGRVAERYYNRAYGNRLMIDHGVVAGRYVTTGYNHAQRYRVHVGQHVRKGQVIGYVGATGYATGCHLHLMVWLNGRRVNPMSWY